MGLTKDIFIKKIRKPAGFVFRFAKTYLKNWYSTRQITDLSHLPLCYFSVLRNEEIEESALIERLLDGDIVIVRNLIEKLSLQSNFDNLSKEFFEIEYEMLDDIHQYKNTKELAEIALEVRESVRLMKLQTSIIKRLMSPHDNTVYVEMQPNLRVHLPFGKVKQHEPFIEGKLGRGKMNPHGQHKDSWRNHPENTINIWLAMTEANSKNGLAVLPQSINFHAKFCPSEKEIHSEVKTYPSQQWVSELSAGDAVLFCAELLHGSVINMTQKSRVCLSMRSTIGIPRFHKRSTPNYVKLTGDKFDNMSISKLRSTGEFEPKSKDFTFTHYEKKQSVLNTVEVNEKHIKLLINEKEKVFPRYCPHGGQDLMNGELDKNGYLLCPAHRMSFRGKDTE